MRHRAVKPDDLPFTLVQVVLTLAVLGFLAVPWVLGRSVGICILANAATLFITGCVVWSDRYAYRPQHMRGR